MAVLWLAAAVGTSGAAAQDSLPLAIDAIEAELASDFEVVRLRPAFERSVLAVLDFGDGTPVPVLWMYAPLGGDAPGHSPRREAAAYEIQRLFLEPHEYVVPPTALRAFPLGWVREYDDGRTATFDDTRSVVVALQGWLVDVTADEVWDPDRFDSDTTYARALGNFNILTFLIRRSGSPEGSVVISRSEPPRVFAVDNDRAFGSAEIGSGTGWHRLRIDRVPTRTIDRLRSVTQEELVRELETLAQFRVRPTGLLTPEPSGPAIDPDRGVRRAEAVIQLGLTRREIRGVWRRIQDLLAAVDDGDIEVF